MARKACFSCLYSLNSVAPTARTKGARSLHPIMTSKLQLHRPSERRERSLLQSQLSRIPQIPTERRSKLQSLMFTVPDCNSTTPPRPHETKGWRKHCQPDLSTLNSWQVRSLTPTTGPTDGTELLLNAPIHQAGRRPARPRRRLEASTAFYPPDCPLELGLKCRRRANFPPRRKAGSDQPRAEDTTSGSAAARLDCRLASTASWMNQPIG